MSNSVVIREIYDRDEWNNIVLGLPNYDLRQGYEWGEVRASQGWKPRRIAVFEGRTCIAAISILAKRFPLIRRSILYAPGGPLFIEGGHRLAWEGLMNGVRDVAKETQAVFMRVSPRVPNNDRSLEKALSEQGFQQLADDWTTWNSPRIVMTLSLLESIDTLRRNLRRRYREYISAASKQNIVIRPAISVQESYDFHYSLAAAGRLKRFPVRQQAYFKRLWDEYLNKTPGILLLAEIQGKVIGGLVGAQLGEKAYLLHVAVRDESWGKNVGKGVLLYWEFIRWAKKAGCTQIDWGGIGTNFPPREEDAGYGLYHFKRGFNSSLAYFTGYHDLSFNARLYNVFRFFERSVSALAWTVRSKLNGRILQAKDLFESGFRKMRQFRVSVTQRGIATTLYWAAFGFLKPNDFLVFHRQLTGGRERLRYTPQIAFEIWHAKNLEDWRAKHGSLSTEFYQDEIDVVDTCAVALHHGEVAGLIWVYHSGDSSRLFSLRDLEVELNNGYVAPTHRGKGIFKNLLDFSCQRLREQGYKAVYAMVHKTNEPSLRAFQAAGFREIGTVRHFFMFRPRIHHKKSYMAIPSQEGF